MSEAAVSCPYCLGDIAPQALVCRHCTRDVSLFQPLIRQLQAQGLRLEQLQSQLDHLTQSLAQSQQAPAHTALQRNFPQGLFKGRMYALKPKPGAAAAAAGGGE